MGLTTHRGHVRGLLAAIACGLLVAGAATSAQAESPKAHASIIGGQPLAAGEERFVVALLENNRFECTGSLIAPDRVLTAAHCIAFGTGPYSVIAGRDEIGNEATGEVINVSSAVVNPAFNMKTPFNDVAVLTLERPSIYPTAALATAEQDLAYTSAGQFFSAAGYGVRNPARFGRPGIGVLRAIGMKTGGACRRQFRKAFSARSMICALGGFAFKRFGIRRGPCEGDSGGPLVKRVDGKPTIFGTVSYGGGGRLFVKCGKTPAVYTRTSSMMPFITANLPPPVPPTP